MQNKTLVDSCLAQLRELITIEAVAAGIETKVDVIEHDDVAVAISQSAERFGVDVICLSTHGRSGLSKTLLGSVAQAVMQQSRRPILVVCRSKE
jgi:nucleotide-binding universal stress UspA family protein